MSETQKYFPFDLQLFAEGGDGAGDGGANTSAADAGDNASDVQDIGNKTLSREEGYKKFKADFKNEFDSEVQGMIQSRLKNAQDFKNKTGQLLSVLAPKYGGNPDDLDSIIKGVLDDNAYYEEEALEKGIPVDQLKHIKQLERENADFKRANEEQQKRQASEKIYAVWRKGAEEVKSNYDPEFDIDSEIANDNEFARLIRAGVPVVAAYEVRHRSELNSKAMAVAARKTEEAVVNKIKANGLRPSENGLSGNAGADLTFDPKNMTKKQREEIKKRVRAGEKISL